MDRLSSLVPTVLRHRGLHTQLYASFVVTKAHQWIALSIPEFSHALNVQHFAHGTLVCRAKHSIAADILTTRSLELIAWLEKEVSDIRIRHVRVIR